MNDIQEYWQKTGHVYRKYPTVRHRKRFIMQQIRNWLPQGPISLFDFGCGDGSLLQEIQKKFGIKNENIFGNDIAMSAIENVSTLFPNCNFFSEAFPNIVQKFDLIICSEVLEHTKQYKDIIAWIAKHLNPGGICILTTQAGKIYASDLYTGHTQHFTMQGVCSALEKHKMTVLVKRQWGFPFFSLQKMLTNVSFQKVQATYLEGRNNWKQRCAFFGAYWLYFLHDFLPYGPQIFIVATNESFSAICNEDNV